MHAALEKERKKKLGEKIPPHGEEKGVKSFVTLRGRKNETPMHACVQPNLQSRGHWPGWTAAAAAALPGAASGPAPKKHRNLFCSWRTRVCVCVSVSDSVREDLFPPTSERESVCVIGWLAVFFTCFFWEKERKKERDVALAGKDWGTFCCRSCAHTATGWKQKCGRKVRKTWKGGKKDGCSCKNAKNLRKKNLQE